MAMAMVMLIALMLNVVAVAMLFGSTWMVICGVVYLAWEVGCLVWRRHVVTADAVLMWLTAVAMGIWAGATIASQSQ